MKVEVGSRLRCGRKSKTMSQNILIKRSLWDWGNLRDANIEESFNLISVCGISPTARRVIKLKRRKIHPCLTPPSSVIWKKVRARAIKFILEVSFGLHERGIKIHANLL